MCNFKRECLITPYHFKCFKDSIRKILKKQPPEVFYEKRCSLKFRKIHRKTPVPESLFNKVAKFLRTPFLQNTSARCFWFYLVLCWILQLQSNNTSVLLCSSLVLFWYNPLPLWFFNIIILCIDICSFCIACFDPRINLFTLFL